MVISPKDLLSYADARLLAAKRAGRARCIGTDAFTEDPLIMAS